MLIHLKDKFKNEMFKKLSKLTRLYYYYSVFYSGVTSLVFGLNLLSACLYNSIFNGVLKQTELPSSKYSRVDTESWYTSTTGQIFHINLVLK